MKQNATGYERGVSPFRHIRWHFCDFNLLFLVCYFVIEVLDSGDLVDAF